MSQHNTSGNNPAPTQREIDFMRTLARMTTEQRNQIRNQLNNNNIEALQTIFREIAQNLNDTQRQTLGETLFNGLTPETRERLTQDFQQNVNTNESETALITTQRRALIESIDSITMQQHQPSTIIQVYILTQALERVRGAQPTLNNR